MSVFVWTIPAAVTTTPASTVPAASVDHVASALARLRSQFRDKPLIVEFMSALVSEVQPVEDALGQLRDERSIDTATGVTLTMLGTIVGEARDGRGDDEYRRLVRARISINRSVGTADDLAAVARAIIDDADARIATRNYGLGGATLTIHDVIVTSDVAALAAAGIREAAAAGVDLDLISSASAHATTLHFDTAAKTLDLTNFADAY